MNTLYLDPDSWDLTSDASNNIAMASEPYSLAQDAASAIRLFKSELYFDTEPGVPYFERVLGHAPPLSLVKSYFVARAMTVPGVVKAVCYLTSWTGRTITGQVQVWDASGNVTAAGF